MLSTLIENITSNDLEDLAGSKINCRIPLSIPVVNMLLQKACDTNSAIELVEVVQIEKNEITLQITMGSVKIAGKKFEVVNREILIQIHPILEPPNFQVRIEVLDGLRRIENEILELLFSTTFKNNTFDFDDRTMMINHSELFENRTYQNLIKRIKTATLETQANKLVYNLQLNF